MNKNELCKYAEDTFNIPGHNCAQAVLLSMAEHFGIKNDILEDLAAPFGGGLSGIRVSVCGAVSGGLMTIGLVEKGSKEEAGKELLKFVQKKYGNINCNKILDIDFNNEQQVIEQKAIKRKTICTPLIKDVCGWLYDRYGQT